MKNHTASMSLFIALSIAGCAAGDEDTLEPQPEADTCQATGAPCPDDTICGQDSCEPAFDRDYQVGVAAIWVTSTKRLDQCDGDPLCAVPSLAVYFSELDDPILVSPEPEESAEIMVHRGSSLIIDLGDQTCLVDLTAERLNAGFASCKGPGSSVTLSLDAI